MLDCNHKRAEYLHMFAAQAHAAAAAAHRRCDYEKAGELSATAQAFSSNAAEKTEEIAALGKKVEKCTFYTAS